MTSYEDVTHQLEQQIRRRAWDVFISYAHEDISMARLLAQTIGDRGFSVWLDTKLKTGDPLRVIDQALRSSGAVIVLLSTRSLSSQWFRHEVATALDNLPARSVFPVAVGELDIRALPLWLAERQLLHLRDGRHVNKLVDQLLPSLDAALGGRDTPIGTARIIGELPPRVPLVGVDEYLRELGSQRTGITWVVGTPGSGKTKLAREYAFQVRNEVDFIWWLSAAGALASELGQQLQHIETQMTNCTGLVVIDGLDAVADDVRESMTHLARLGTLHRVVVTARRINNARFMRPYDYTVMTVGPLSRAAVADYLEAFTPELEPQERARLERVAQSLGGSPLLLRLVTLALRQRALDDVLPDLSTPAIVVDRTLMALLDQLSADERHRLHVLSFCADLLTRVRTDDKWLLPGDEALFSRLVSWGVCTEQGGRTAFAHQLITDYVRRNATRQALEDAIAYITARLPDPDNNIEVQDLLTSVVDLTELTELDWDHVTSANLAELLIWQASVWRSASEPERAEFLCTRALSLAKQSEQTLLQIRSMNLQSALSFDRGRIAQAASIERRTADLALTELGPGHPISIASLANLATSLRAQGDLPEAITLLRRVVAQSRETLPHGDPDLVTACSNLAICLREAGIADEAMPLLMEAIDQTTSDRTRLHLDQVLAALLVDVGQLDEASIVLTESIARAETLQVSSPSDLLTMRANLAAVYARLGRHDEALSIQSDIADRFAVLHGPDHPSTLSARSNYAMLLSETGATGEALQLHMEVAASRARVLGSDHPDTLQSWLLAARAASNAGDNERARGIYVDLLGDVVRVFGPEHAFSFTVREELAQQLDRTGNVQDARLAYRELLADLERVLPPDHSMVRRIRASARRRPDSVDTSLSGEPPGRPTDPEQPLRELRESGGMAMICPDCQQDLDDVPVGDPCPQCRGKRRSAVVQAQAAMAAVSAMSVTVSIGYSLEPGWAYQWNGIQRHLARLREQYQGIGMLGNVDVEQTVHSLFLGLYHLYDWLHQDSALSVTEPAVKAWINQHPDSLGLCRDYANIWKHMKRNQSGARIAQITRIESGSNGQKVTIGYRPWDKPAQPMTEVDGLDLAEQSERDWRDFLKMHGISIPS